MPHSDEPLVTCHRCGHDTSTSNKFCPNCGFQASAQLDDVDRYLADRVKTELGNLLKDQKVVEIEIAEAVATRLSNWGKLAGYFLGVCIAVLVLALGVVGIKTMADLQNIGESVRKDVSEKFEKEIATKYQDAAEKVSKELETKYRKETESQMAEVRSKGELLLADFERLKVQLGDVKDSLTERVDSIEKKVDRFKLQTSDAVSPATRSELEASLIEYQKHLVSLGYVPDRGHDVTVMIKSNVPEPGALAYYDPSKRAVVVNIDAAKGMNLKDLVLREYGHRVMLSLKDYFDSLDADQVSLVTSVQAGMVTFLVCSFQNKPIYGGPPSSSPLSEDLAKPRKVSTIRPGMEWAVADGSPAWGSLFWAIRNDIGQDPTERSLIAAWKQWDVKSTTSTTDFCIKVLSEVKTRVDDEAEVRIRKTMTDWGIDLK